MAIATTCPNCKALFRLADEMAGKKVKCQKCAYVFNVASADVKAAPEAAKSAPDMELDAPKKATEPDVDEETPDGAIMADDDPDARPSKKGAPPPPVGKKSKESSLRTRRAPSDSGSSATMVAVIIVLIGGGFFACAGACGVGGWLYYASEEKPAPPPMAAANDANKDGGNKDDPGPGIDGGKMDGGRKDGKKGGKVPGPPPIPPAPPPKGINVVFGPDGIYSTDDNLNQTDLSSFNKKLKLYLLQMEAGKTYQIDMVSLAKGFDPYLRLLDEKNQSIVEDDDGGGFPNARIVFRAPRTGLFRIHATYFGGLTGNSNYRLVVTRTDGQK